mgnify:CR=1 FL=1
MANTRTIVDGTATLYNAADTQRLVPQDKRVRLAHSFIDVLADLHAVDPDAAGLSDLGKKDLNSPISWKARTWIDHQPYTNCEALINRGYQVGEFGIVDLLAQHSYGYDAYGNRASHIETIAGVTHKTNINIILGR